jgi:hypothetical protein
MRGIIERWLAPALVAGLVLSLPGAAQPPGPEEGRLKRRVQPARISVEEIVERVMAFDKNKDGKVTKDELPERMHHLIALGDTNKDGALDRDEVRKLATTLAGPPGGPGGRVAGGFGGPGGFATGIRQDVRFGPGPGPGTGDVEGVVDDLKLSGKKKERALAAAKAHRENVVRLMARARGELLQKMKEILSEEELKDFRAALDRPRGVTALGVGPRDAPGGGVERKPARPRE